MVDSSGSQIITPDSVASAKAKLISEAARKRRLEKAFGPDLFRSDFFWDAIQFEGGLYCLLWPLRKELQRRARRHARSPRVFRESVERLMLKRLQVDPQSRWNLEVFQRLCARMFPAGPASSGAVVVNLSKDQKQQRGAFLDFLELTFLPLLRGRLPSEGDAKTASEYLHALSKSGRGRKLDSDSKKIIELAEAGTRGRAAIAGQVWPEKWANADERPDLKRKVGKCLSRWRVGHRQS